MLRHVETLCVMSLFLAWGLAGKGEEPLPRSAESTPAVADLLETVGLLAGSQLYQTYLNIGLLADARAEGLYPDRDVKKVLGSVLLPLEKIDRQLEKLEQCHLSASDRAALAELRRISGLLRQQGRALESYWASGAESDGEAYESARQKAWEALRDLLDLDAIPPEEAPAPRVTDDPRPKG